MKSIKMCLAACVVLVLGLGGILPALALADNPQATVCDALGSDKNCTSTPDNTVKLSTVLTATINIFSVVIGIVAVIMIMVAGFRYITAAGDSSKITSAKNTLIYAIVGLVVAATSQVLVRSVLARVTK
jgi:hypothetical protein